MTPLDYIENFSGAVAQHPLVALGVAAVAGLLSTSVCPCTLPGGVGLVGYAGSQADNAPEEELWRRGALIALAFFVGLVTSLTALGIAAANLGDVLTSWDGGFAAAIAIIMLLVGLVAIFGPAVRRRIPAPAIRTHSGIGGAFVYGLLFGVATITSSAAPLLRLLTVAAAIGHLTYGALISLSYAIGRGLPFLLVGLFAGNLEAWLVRTHRAQRVTELVSGITLLGLAGYFGWLGYLL
jgi:cytochrome c-type biogenesis protein